MRSKLPALGVCDILAMVACNVFDVVTQFVTGLSSFCDGVDGRAERDGREERDGAAALNKTPHRNIVWLTLHPGGFANFAGDLNTERVGYFRRQ